MVNNSHIKIAMAKTPNCELYPLHKQILEYTHFLSSEDPFTLRYWYWMNKITSKVLCACGCKKELKNPKKTKFLQGHSNSSQEVKNNKKQAIQAKYGEGITNVSQLDSVKDKKEATFQARYGYKCPLDQKNVVPIWLEKHGVSNPSKLEEVRKKISEAHRVIQPLLLEQRMRKFMDTHWEKIINDPLFEPLFTKEEYTGVRKEYQFRCRKCGTIQADKLTDGRHFRCYTCNPRIDSGGQSILENEVQKYIESLGVVIDIQNRSIIAPMEIDLYIPELKLGIEVHGLYWHSKRHRWYHKFKKEACEKVGVNLIQIFEDEWKEKKDICKARLRHLLGKNYRRIHGRKCDIRIILHEEKTKFLRKYHIQGNDKSIIHYGAFYKNRLISVMTFGMKRKILGYKESKKGDWELVRFCSLFHFHIPGIAGKLLKRFIKDFEPKTLITYADKRWSKGNLYEKLGFIKTGETVPSYWYIKGDKRFHRLAFRKHLLEDKLNGYDESKTEWENMEAHGYQKIWDCGHYRFEIK